MIYYIWHGEENAKAPDLYAVTARVSGALFELEMNSHRSTGLGQLAKDSIESDLLMELHKYGYITLLREVARD